MNKFRLEIDERQARVLLHALDLYSRLGMGQWEILAEFTRDLMWKSLEAELAEAKVPKEDRFDIVLRRMEVLRGHLKEIKALVLGQAAHSSWGIYNEKVASNCRAAYDIQQVLRKTVAEAGAADREAKGENVQRWTVDFQDLSATCEDQPAAKCWRVMQDGDRKAADLDDGMDVNAPCVCGHSADVHFIRPRSQEAMGPTGCKGDANTCGCNKFRQGPL